MGLNPCTMLPKLAGVVILIIILIIMIMIVIIIMAQLKWKKLFLWHTKIENKSLVEKERHNKSKAKLEGCLVFSYGQTLMSVRKKRLWPPIHPSIHLSIQTLKKKEPKAGNLLMTKHGPIEERRSNCHGPGPKAN